MKMPNAFRTIYLSLFILLSSITSLSVAAETESCPANKIDEWTQATFATAGDTLLVQGQLVRLIGIVAPSIEKKQKFFQAGQPLAKESQTFLNKLIANNGMEVGLEYDEQKRDTFGRILAHVYFRDGSNAAQRVLAAGLGLADTVSPNSKHSDCYFNAERQARQNTLGLWGVSQTYPELKYPLAQSSKLSPEDIGFRIIRGEVKLVDKSSSNIIINLDTTGIRVSKRFWKYFDYDAVKNLKGKVIEVRGYASQYKRAMYLSIESPNDIDLLQNAQK